jgi:hypothetical protein
MDHSKPIVMTHNMNKYGNLLLYRGVDAILKQPSLHKRFYKCIEIGSSHPNHLDNLYIVAVVDVIQVFYPLLVLWYHRTLGEMRKVIMPNYSLLCSNVIEA